jgi:hypothetical protein
MGETDHSRAIPFQMTEMVFRYVSAVIDFQHNELPQRQKKRDRIRGSLGSTPNGPDLSRRLTVHALEAFVLASLLSLSDGACRALASGRSNTRRRKKSGVAPRSGKATPSATRRYSTGAGILADDIRDCATWFKS